MSDFELNGQSYKIGRLDAFQQLHVGRRLGPGVVRAITSIADIAAIRAVIDGEKIDFDRFKPLLQDGVGALAAMPDDDANFVLMTCLGAVQRKQGDAWVSVKAAGILRLMFDDIDAWAMMQIVFRVIGENLFTFFTVSGRASK